MTWILMLAVWGKEVVLRCVWRWDRWCPWYENTGTLIWAPEQGYVHARLSLEHQRGVFWGEREFILIGCQLLASSPVCLCSHQGENILFDSTSLLCLLQGWQVSPQLWEWKQFVVQKQQAQEIVGFWKSHWITAQVTEAWGLLSVSLRGGKKKDWPSDDFTSCHTGVPLPEDSTDQQN